VRGAGIATALGAHQLLARAGYRASFFALPALIAGCSFALAGIDHAWAFGAFLGIGLAAGAQSPILATYVNRRIPSERRATILSVQGVAGSFMLAGSQPVAGMIADMFGLRPLFLAFGVAMIVLVPVVLVLWTRAEDTEQAELEALDRELYGRERTTDAVPVS
jgi:MFS family permease